MRFRLAGSCIVLVAVAAVFLGSPNQAAAQAYTETFDGFTANSSIGQSADWSNFANEPTVTAGQGVGASAGLAANSSVFNWTAHPFSWTNDVQVGGKVVMKMDFQTSSGAKFDDDRLGWTVNSTSNGSGYQFGVQLDSTQVNPGVSSYWRLGGVNTTTNSFTALASCAALTNLTASAFYRFEADFTKLTDTSAKIDCTVWRLDASGNIDGTWAPITGSYADTSLLGTNSVVAGYFSAASMVPTFKNYNTDAGYADNAYFAIVPAPEPATMSLLVLGGLALLRRARR
jgi:hypothetical protein